MSQSPALVESLAKEHLAELRRRGNAPARTRCEAGRADKLGAARRRLGWLLIDIGLRLAARASLDRRYTVTGN